MTHSFVGRAVRVAIAWISSRALFIRCVARPCFATHSLHSERPLRSIKAQ